tara:strand:+ start:13035 stop:14108 length:1074 start_codon:yes stop_codon:yes gene_type:complete
MATEVAISSDMKARIIDKVVRVLHKNHSHPEKRRLLESKERLNFACPYCGDSTDSVRKKRGNLYWNNLHFHCYNCSAHESLDVFLKDHNLNFEGDERINVLNYIKDNSKNFSLGESLEFHLFEKANGLALSFDEVALGFNVYPINSLTYRAYPYLKSRLLHHKTEKFGYDPRRKELYVFNLNKDNKIIGFQVRALENTGGPKYKTWNLERIYDRLKKPLNVSEDELDSLNKISMIFGILTVNLGREFTIFEGPIDSFFMSNTLGLTGVKKQILDFDEIPTARYMFDNDYEGKAKMMQKLKKGQTVFMWDKYLKDFNIPKKKVKDLNDLIKYEYSKRTGCLQEVDKYFTNNHLDLIFL